MIGRQLPGFTQKPMLWAIHTVARFARPLTMGVRAVILDGGGRVFLVRHSYLPGWHFPGGGVEPGETAQAAMIRETREEGGLEVLDSPVLHGLFFNRRLAARDHVAVFVVRAFRVMGDRTPDWEIVETGFFDPQALPEGTTEATRARLREVLDGAPPSELW